MRNTLDSERTTTISFGGVPLEVIQAGAPCRFTLTPAAVAMKANGGTGTFNVAGVGTDCSYTAESNHSGVTITAGGSGTAPATVSYSVAPNLLPENTWSIKVGEAFFGIHQNGSPIASDTRVVALSVELGTGPAVARVSDPEVFHITNAEQADATYSATADAPWVSISAPTGHTPASLRVAVDPAAASPLVPGFYTARIAVSSSVAPTVQSVVTVYMTVFAAGATSTPFGVFETPFTGATNLAGAVPVTGWALDSFGIARVSIFRDSVVGEANGLVWIGDATRVRGARPDVRSGYVTFPATDRSGWGYMLLSNVLPGGGNGTFTFTVVAENLEGNRVTLGRRTVTFNNAAAINPFGTIDVPAQGETVSGTIVNRGWVLTPAAKTVPIDGSTIKVYIDGALFAPVTAYNLPRPDVKSYFPSLANSNGPEASVSIDTTQFADGVHTIEWGVIDDGGAPEGIGSRYFTIQNGSASQVQRADTSQAASVVEKMRVLRTDVWSRQGVDDAAWAVRAGRDASGERIVRARRGARLEVFLDPTLRSACGTYDGHLLSGNVAGTLPDGASLDDRHGIFRWQPTAWFTGTYRFVFVQRGCDGIDRRIPLSILIGP
jgi:hypothetical protein